MRAVGEWSRVGRASRAPTVSLWHRVERLCDEQMTSL